MASEAEKAVLRQRFEAARTDARATLAATMEKGARARAAKVPTATVTKTAGKPTATERVRAQQVLADGGDPHEIDKAVLVLLAAGREAELATKAAESERWNLLDRATLTKSQNLWRTRLPTVIEEMRDLLDATPVERAGRVEKAREMAFRESTSDGVRFRLGEAARLSELVGLADRWGNQTAPARDQAAATKARKDQLAAQLTKQIEAALAPAEAQIAEITKLAGGRPAPKGQR